MTATSHMPHVPERISAANRHRVAGTPRSAPAGMLVTSLALLALCASIGTAAGAGDRGAPPSSGSSATATSDVEQARAAARAHAIARQLPAAETAALAGPPLAVHPMRLANGDHGTRYEWLGSGKGGGWHLHVIVNDRTGATDVVSGFERE